jgi:hypothetical protein
MLPLRKEVLDDTFEDRELHPFVGFEPMLPMNVRNASVDSLAQCDA